MQKSTHTHTHTHGCLCKIIPAIASLAIINPSYSDIAKNAQSATCDSNTIGTTTGSANLEAAWTANTINLDFYSNDTKVGTGSCSYDGGIILPNTPDVPTGYTFGGWKLRSAAAYAPAQQTTFDLSVLDTNMGAIVELSKNFAGDYCFYDNKNTHESAEEACVETIFGGLNTGEWQVDFEYGSVKGIASCNNTESVSYVTCTTGKKRTCTYHYGNDAQPENSMNSSTSGLYCWCKTTGFAGSNNGFYQAVSPSSWVFAETGESASDCADYCADTCRSRVAGDLNIGKGFRDVLYGKID